MIYFILFVIAIIAILFLRDTNKELTNLNEKGGVTEKYNTLIKALESNNYKLVKVTAQAAYLIWDDVVIKSQITILHAFDSVIISYETTNKLDKKVIAKKRWEFSNSKDQNSIIEKLEQDIYTLLKNFNNGIEYDERQIKNIIQQNSELIFQKVKAAKDSFSINDKNIKYADEYFKYICFIKSGAILANKFIRIGFNDNDEEWKILFRLIYYNSLSFYKKYVKTGYIEIPNLDEDYLLLTIDVKFNQYLKDLNHFYNTQEPFYIEELDYDEEYGIINNIIQYKFIQDIYQIEFEENQKGIYLSFNYKEILGEPVTEKSIQETMILIKNQLADLN